MNALVIVESPAKAKTINKYLGRGYRVLASYGHVRDLPAKDGSVDPDRDFAMKWQVDAKSAKRLNDIARALKDADELILATDPDREGEAISWHVLEVLKKKGALKDKEVARVVFNAVTPAAVRAAMEEPRDIDRRLVEAYLARRALDYLVGFTLSPVLWRKLPGARSAGRVQSVALGLVAQRENEIESFTPQEYWSIEAALKNAAGDAFTAKVAEIDGRKLKKLDIANEEQAKAIETALRDAAFSVRKVESKPQQRHPAPPFTTSTLEQEASRKLGFTSRQTMQVAQKLYEGVDIGGETVGLITYMRTDAVTVAPEGIAQAREVIARRFGDAWLPEKPRAYKTKAKAAQEAHEAIRPTDATRHPEEVRQYLSKEEAALYELIWKRAIAAQMSSARFERTTADIAATGADGKDYALRATGQVLRFDGFLTLYREGVDDKEDEEDARRLPPLAEGETVTAQKIEARQHFTEPPPRYTEASLIRKLEELGIGRPSTYTAILTTLRDREYVRMEKKRLVPEGRGRLVTAFLESFFPRYVEYDFTAALEEKLDRIAAGEEDWKRLLRDFWVEFKATVEKTEGLRVSDVLEALNDILGPQIFPRGADGQPDRACPQCKEGTLSLKVGKFGAFIGCSNYPDCNYTRQLTGNGKAEAPEAESQDDVLLGEDPDTGLPVYRRSGRFGPYVQLGEAVKGGEKPKRASIPKGVDPASVDLDYALKLLALPREIGKHPETGEPVLAGIGRYGPYVQHRRTYANLKSADELFTIGINRAVDLLARKEQRGTRQVLKELGEHPEGGAMQVLDGRYGPYVKWGRINATLPKDIAPEDVTPQQAVELIAAKQARKGGKRGRKAG
ncbi:MAG TPA: type I DNA topoisomerase [Thermopetrobacter sp.]|nr:type I DNA topoisomerase [Thermopetrobacter sp.]